MTNYNRHQVEDHEPFIFEQLLPLIVDYARVSGTPSEVVALACWLCLSTILQAKGMSRGTLIACLDEVRLDAHATPEGLH